MRSRPNSLVVMSNKRAPFDGLLIDMDDRLIRFSLIAKDVAP